MINDYLSLSTRAGFNKSLTHFRMVTEIVRQMGQGENLADIVDRLEKGKSIEKAQITPILNAVVVDRAGYHSLSFNLPVDVQSFDTVQEETQRWNRLDIIIAYHHPQLGINLINPKHKGHWETARELVVLGEAAGALAGAKPRGEQVRRPLEVPMPPAGLMAGLFWWVDGREGYIDEWPGKGGGAADGGVVAF